MTDDLPGLGDDGASAVGSTVPAPLPLARRADFRLGAATVRPSVRTIDGPDGSATAEPRVMQVLLAFVDADGAVLTREDLIRIAWNGTIVGDDSVNRAIAEVRRISRETSAGFTIETIPRIGYRLEAGATEAEAETALADALPAPATRRWVIGGTVAVALGGVGLWSALRDRADPRAALLVERGKQALRLALPDSDAQGVSAFSEAVAIEPRNAEAWGLLALALRNKAENSEPDGVTGAVEAMEQAARRALALDPTEGNALTALATIRPAFGDWLNAEKRLLAVLKVAPDNVAAISSFVLLLQQVDRRRDSWIWNERVIALDPLSPIHQFRRALKQWIFGRIAESDQTIERALQLWPRHPAIWNARKLTFAFTGRAGEGLAFIDDVQARPPTAAAPTIAYWRSALTALESRAPADIAATRKAMLDAAPRSPGFAASAILILSALGQIDDAFAVAEGYLLRRGRFVGTLWTGSGQMPVTDMRWRRTMFIFTPATVPMRADPRFKLLLDGIGLTDYWRQRGIGPD